MTFVPIERVDIENYGCIQKASFALTPLHALIGPNDSGKSTTLRAINMCSNRLSKGFGGGPRESSESVTSNTVIDFVYPDGYRYKATPQARPSEALMHNGSDVATWYNGVSFGNPPSKTEEQCSAFNARTSRPTMVRFDPDSLRKPAALIPESQGITFANERGAGLSSVFDAIINRDTDAFMSIQIEARTMFPSLAKLGLINVSDSMKEIAATLVDGTRVGASELSEGLLYYLGFAALKYLDNTNLFLVEEPENGLHPARISEVMRSLREISKTSQVVIATHSPLVVNELQGNEISVVTRDSQSGTKAVLLQDVPGFEDAAKVYRPGEFWVSYCDGDQETPLLTGTART